MCVEIIPDQHNLLSLCILFIDQLLEQMGEVYGDPLLGHLYPPIPGQWLEHHEQVRGALPFIFIIDALGLSQGRAQLRKRVAVEHAICAHMGYWYGRRARDQGMRKSDKVDKLCCSPVEHPIAPSGSAEGNCNVRVLVDLLANAFSRLPSTQVWRTRWTVIALVFKASAISASSQWRLLAPTSALSRIRAM